MAWSAFRASSSALAHTFEQQFCRCGSPLMAQPLRAAPSSATARRRAFASSARWREQLEQATSSGRSSSGSSVANSLHSAGIPPVPAAAVAQTSASASKPAATATMSRPARREIKAAKAAIHLTPTAVSQLTGLLDSPTPKLIRIGVRNKGCAGMAYHLEYVDKPGKFDEVVKQDGVQVLIDSKALFSIVGSEMDWQEDKISSKFVFNNPNIKEQCGCGESFMT